MNVCTNASGYYSLAISTADVLILFTACVWGPGPGAIIEWRSLD